MQWDPQQYTRFSDHRLRPFLDLVARIGVQEPDTVLDVGCGPGNATATLAERWPQARITGVDSSAEMIERAGAVATEHLDFRVQDAHEADVAQADVVVSNAMLQWLPDHRDLLETWAGAMRPGSWLAFQVPGNFTAPSHQAMRDVAAQDTWAARLDGALLGADTVDTAQEYASRLLAAGWEVDAWETSYVQWLAGEDPVLEWVRGTALRPVLARLDPAEISEFERRYAALVAASYPSRPGPDGNLVTALPFRRIFVVAHRPA